MLILDGVLELHITQKRNNFNRLIEYDMYIYIKNMNRYTIRFPINKQDQYNSDSIKHPHYKNDE
jgi:hypothetical protein